MKHAVTLLLDTDTIDWADVVARNLSRQRKREVSRSEAMEYLVLGHWKKYMRKQHEKQMDDRLDRKVAEKRFGIVKK